MKLPPRTHRLALASLLLALAPTATTAATRQQQPPAQNRRDAKAREQRETKTRDQRDARTAGQREAKARERQVRAQAVAALLEAAEAVRPADDLNESVRLRAGVAGVLWPHDAPSARALLRRAWEAANAPGAEERVAGLGIAGDAREDARETLLVARRFVIKAALKHDPRLAEEFVRQFERELSEEVSAAREGEGDAPLNNGGGARGLSRAGWQRLNIAFQFLEEGEHELAAATAAPLVSEGPTTPLLDFLHMLRPHAPRAADALYLRLLERTRADPSANANDLLLLSTPVVSPELRAQVAHDGSVSFSPVSLRIDYASGPAAADATTPLAPEARRAFFNVAAAVLLRPRANTSDPAQRGDAAAQLYFTAARLLPSFEREAAQHAPALHALLSSLAADIDASRRDLLASRAGVSSLSAKNSADALAHLHKAVADAPNAVERDWERFLLVTAAAHRRQWDRARLAAAEIEDEETRRNARRALAMQQVLDISRAYEDDKGARSDDGERAADFVRAADVPPEVRAAGLAQAAEVAARRKHKARASELLVEAASHAEQSERASGRRATAFALLTLSAARLEDPRAWDSLQALVSAANEEDDLAFAALSFDYTFNHLGRSVPFSVPTAPQLDLGAVFAATARIDPARTLAEARALEDELVRANMLFAAARAALEKTGKADARAAP